jgi:hypothetical protein
MSTTARAAEELLVTMPTKVGLLAEVADALAAAGVNILAILAQDKPGAIGEVRFVPSDEDAAEAALKAIGAKVTREPVLVLWVPHELGSLDRVVRRIADAGVNIESAYVTTADTDHATIIMRTDDDAKVLGFLG